MSSDFSCLNVPLGRDIAKQLLVLANQQHCSLDDMAKQLIERGIEDLEDERLGFLAMGRICANEEPYLNHEDAWK